LVGLTVGNMITLPGLVVQREFAHKHFARAISLVIAIDQVILAFGPGQRSSTSPETPGHVPHGFVDTTRTPILGKPTRSEALLEMKKKALATRG
jgi:hypothetical protein